MSVKNRSVQLQKREIAARMIGYGMRASIIAEIFDLPLAQARMLYEEIAGRTSPSGQKPRSDAYYFAPVMRMHASLFLLLYRYAVRTGKDPRAAIVEAYAYYHEQCRLLPEGTAVLPIDRAWLLVQLAKQKDGAVRQARCSDRNCRIVTIIQPYESAVRYRCPDCVGSLEVSKRLRGRSGRKKKQPVPRPVVQQEVRTSA